MRTRDIAKLISEQTGLSIRQTQEVISLFEDILLGHVMEYGDFRWPAIGIFRKVFLSRGKKVSGLTGKDYRIPPRATARLVPSSRFLRCVRDE